MLTIAQTVSSRAPFPASHLKWLAMALRRFRRFSPSFSRCNGHGCSSLCYSLKISGKDVNGTADVRDGISYNDESLHTYDHNGG